MTCGELCWACCSCGSSFDAADEVFWDALAFLANKPKPPTLLAPGKLLPVSGGFGDSASSPLLRSAALAENWRAPHGAWLPA